MYIINTNNHKQTDEDDRRCGVDELDTWVGVVSNARTHVAIHAIKYQPIKSLPVTLFYQKQEVM